MTQRGSKVAAASSWRQAHRQALLSREPPNDAARAVDEPFGCTDIAQQHDLGADLQLQQFWGLSSSVTVAEQMLRSLQLAASNAPGDLLRVEVWPPLLSSTA